MKIGHGARRSMLRRRRSTVKSDVGAVGIIAVFVVMLAVVLLAFVVDRGQVYYTKAQFQKGLDAAALAGAAEYCGGRELPAAMAIKYGEKNSVTIAPEDIIPGQNGKTSYINVRSGAVLDLPFGGFVGASQISVASQATASNACTRAYAYGVFAEGLWTINGGGTGLSVAGAGAYAGSVRFNGNGGTLWFFDPVGLESPDPDPDPGKADWSDCSAAEWPLCPSDEQIPKVTPNLTTSKGDTVTYATSLGLDGYLNGEPGFIPRLGTQSEPNWYKVGEGDCTIDQDVFTEHHDEVLYCDGIASVSGIPSADTKMVRAAGISIVDDVGDVDGIPYCPTALLLYATSEQGAEAAGNDKTVCGTIYSPMGEYSTNGNGLTVSSGQVIAKSVSISGNGGIYVNRTGDPILDSSFVALTQ